MAEALALSLAPDRRGSDHARAAWRSALPAALLAVGLFALAAPALLALGRTHWITEAGALGPLILSIGGWMLWREWRRAAPLAIPGGMAGTLALLLPAALLYVAALTIAMTSALCVAVWLALVGVLYGVGGGAATRACWFPLLFLLLLVPVPYSLGVAITAALRAWLSVHAVGLAALLGMAVAVDGSAVFVDQYQLAVEAACAGLNSMISLLCVGPLYAYWLRGAGAARVVAVMAAAIPIALAANLLRVLLLIVAVHLGGSGVLATPLHPVSGFAAFGLALALVAGVDLALARLAIMR